MRALLTPIAWLAVSCLGQTIAYADNTVCTLIAEATPYRLVNQTGACDRRVTPASIFKIAISLMGYDAGFLVDETTPALPFKQGYPDWNPAWRTTVTPTTWIRDSVVWYSQQITQALGDESFRHYVEAFRYGNTDVSGDSGTGNGLTHAWLSSSLEISPLEELDFMRRLVGRQLPVSAHAFEMTGRITRLDARPGGWTVHGKTGTGFPHNSDGSLDETHSYGWFVGWAEKGDRTFVFVRLTQDQERHEVPAGLRARDAFLQELPLLISASRQQSSRAKRQ